MENLRSKDAATPYFYCWWEDSQGIFSEAELKEFFKQVGQGYEFNINSNLENSEVLGWIVNGDPHSFFDNLKLVINFLNEENDPTLVASCDNMRIKKVL
jgi:hypothetical protein